MPSTSTDRLNGLSTSVAIKPPCRVATTANITLSGEQTIDGVAVVSGDRVLVKDQTDATENGIYVVDTTAWDRAKDFDGNRDVVTGTMVLVRPASSSTLFYECTSANPIVIGTSNITFEATPQITPSSYIETLLDDTTAAEARATLELGYLVAVTDSRFGTADPTGVASSQTAVAAAVTHCYTEGIPLYWPDGTYLTTATIPNFHDVKHVGPGVVKRGSDLFAVQPKEGDANTLYVDPAGSASNDGLSSSQAISTMAAAFAVLDGYGPVLAGTWTLTLAASSSYDYSLTVDNLKTANRLVIQGPAVGHPNVPTALVSPASPAATGWRFVGSGLAVQVKDVKFVNFDSNASSFALGAVDGADVETQNVHIDDATLGVVGDGLAHISVYGGIIENCDEGIRSLFGCKHTIGTGTLANDPTIKNCVTGLSARESSSGHCWANIQDNTFGIDVQANARVNCSGSDFKRNTVAIRARGANVLYDGATFNTGTADENGMNVRLQNYGVDLSAAPYANTSRIEHREFPAVSHTGTTTETILKTHTLTAGQYVAVSGGTYQGKHIKLTMRGSLVGTAGIKTFRLRINGVSGSTASALFTASAAAGRYEYVCDMYLTTATAQRTFGKLSTDGIVVEHGAASTTDDFGSSSNVTLDVTGVLANSADTITVDFFEVEVDG